MLTPDQRRRIEDSILECDRFIAKEEARAADLRPASVAFLLDKYKVHRVKLQAMLKDERWTNPVADATRKEVTCGK